jgi:hypothetical protein
MRASAYQTPSRRRPIGHRPGRGSDRTVRAIAISEKFSRPPYQLVCAWLCCSFIRADRRLARWLAVPDRLCGSHRLLGRLLELTRGPHPALDRQGDVLVRRHEWRGFPVLNERVEPVAKGLKAGQPALREHPRERNFDPCVAGRIAEQRPKCWMLDPSRVFTSSANREYAASSRRASRPAPPHARASRSSTGPVPTLTA